MNDDTDSDLPRTAIAAMLAASGAHEGRVVYVKGGWAEATFTGTPQSAALCRAPFLNGRSVDALVRFSNAGGDPAAHDGDPGGRGIAVKLYLDGGDRCDLLGISVPCFTARTPEDFVKYVQLARRDPDTGQPDMAKIATFLAAHPETAAALALAGAVPPPASWLAVTYNGIHAFRWSAADGRARWVRTRWVPTRGNEFLTDEDAHQRDRDYLAADLRRRLADATAVWPDDREAVTVGRLVVEHAIEAPETASDIRVFDPMRLCDGIEASADPILQFRPKVYDLSARGRCPAATMFRRPGRCRLSSALPAKHRTPATRRKRSVSSPSTPSPPSRSPSRAL
ncbi:MAG: catalase [Acidimicrobiia bacterium]